MGPFSFPISKFKDYEFQFLTEHHVPVDHTEKVWTCSVASTIHLEDWTNVYFIDASSRAGNISTPPTKTVSLLRHYLAHLLLRSPEDRDFGASGFSTMHTNPVYHGKQHPPTSTTIQWKFIWIKKIGGCVLVLPFKEEASLVTFYYDKMCTVHPFQRTRWKRNGGCKQKLPDDVVMAARTGLQQRFTQWFQ